LARLGHELGQKALCEVARIASPDTILRWYRELVAKKYDGSARFFPVEVLSWARLVRYHVLFMMDLASRRVEIAEISRRPDGGWMEQVARNLLDAGDGFRGVVPFVVENGG
jgi:hypothetical protein